MRAPAITALVLTRYPARSAMLETALASFRAQTFRDAEVLIVNDGAPMEHPSPGVRVLNLPAGATAITIGDKRNAGLRAARGEWIAPWDDDDVCLPERLAESFAALDGGRVAYVKSTAMWVADADVRVAGLCAGCCYGTALFHRETALRAGGFAGANYAEDQAFLERLGAAGAACRDLDFRWYVHRRHDSNVSALICGESLAWFLERALATPPAEIAAVQGAVDDIVQAAARARRAQQVARRARDLSQASPSSRSKSGPP